MNNRTLFNMLQKIRRSLPAVIALLFVATIVVAARPAGASDQVSVQGTFTERVYRGTDCPSPIHICGKGPLKGEAFSGVLTGILNTENDIFQNGQLVEIIFNGTASIVTDCGTLSGPFVVNEQIPSFTSTSVLTVTAGTRDCKGTTGVLNFSAAPDPRNGNVEIGTFSGFLVNGHDD